MGELILVRHPPVATAWQGRCYGQSDPGLSHEGRAMVAPLIDTLAALKPDVIIHSDMARTRAIAEPLARLLGVECSAQPLWRERHFGSWEGQSWDAIYRVTGNAMDGMLSDPAGFRPGDDGETTAELVRRTLAAMRALAPGKRTLVVTHGGPIAAARMLADRLDFGDLPKLIIPTGGHVRIKRADAQRAIETPCIRLCQLDARQTRCLGCLRTRDEIGQWGNLDRQKQQQMIAALNDRNQTGN
jgi:broad specificity phosphatase PhoE